jgi:hypothetical protein
MKHWYEISPEEAAKQRLDLSKRTDIKAPKNEEGEVCPFPWEPQLLTGAPLNQFHCQFCGAVVVAGIPHVDYSDVEVDIENIFLGWEYRDHQAEDGESSAES